MNWFLIYQNEHLGPYDEASLEELYLAGDINKESLIWREGLDAPEKYEVLFLIKEVEEEFIPIEKNIEHVLENLPPDLPVESDEVDIPPFPGQNLDQSNTFDDSEPPALPIVSEVNLEESFEQEEKMGKSKLWPWVLLLIFVVIFLFLLPFFRPTSFERPEAMDLARYEELKEKINSIKKEDIFIPTLSADKKTIWIVTNSHLEGGIQFNFNSEGLITLGQGTIEVQGEARLEKHLIEIKDFDLVQGLSFVDGKYKVSLKSTDNIHFPPLKFLYQFRELNKINFVGNELVSSLSENNFNKAVASKFKRARKNSDQFFRTLREEYRTVQTITKQIIQGVQKIFSAGDVNFEEAIGEFETNYKRNYGVFFSSFILSVDKKYEIINEKDFPDKIKVISHYTKLKKLAEQIGAESVRVLGKLKGEDLIATKVDDLKEMELESTIKFREIVSECDRMVKLLN